jgi:hypothetical protein
MNYRLEEWDFGWEFGECVVHAINDIGDGSVVSLHDVILLWGEIP